MPTLQLRFTDFFFDFFRIFFDFFATFQPFYLIPLPSQIYSSHSSDILEASSNPRHWSHCLQLSPFTSVIQSSPYFLPCLTQHPHILLHSAFLCTLSASFRAPDSISQLVHIILFVAGSSWTGDSPVFSEEEMIRPQLPWVVLTVFCGFWYRSTRQACSFNIRFLISPLILIRFRRFFYCFVRIIPLFDSTPSHALRAQS